jgi:hypothetical protein
MSYLAAGCSNTTHIEDCELICDKHNGVDFVSCMIFYDVCYCNDGMRELFLQGNVER